MELYEGLLSRRSIRKYTGERIQNDKILAMIKAGMYAPSANNKRPWHFIIIDDREIMKKIMDAHPYAAMLAEASHAIAVCGDDTLQNGVDYFKLDCSNASQNILLAAHSMGLGAVWLAVEPRRERIDAIVRILGLPANIHPVSIISVGVPVAIPTNLPDRFEEAKIKRNKW